MTSRHKLAEGPRVFVHPVRIAFRDCTGNRRLFYPKMFALLHDAYEAMLESNGISIVEILRERRRGAPLVHAGVDFIGHAPAYGAALEIVLTAGTAGDHSISFGYRVLDAESGEVVALGSTSHAFIDFATMKRATVPDDFRAMVARFPADGRPEDAGWSGPMGRELRQALLEAPSTFTHRVSVGFDDVDAAGFVYFAQTLAMFHRGSVAMRRARGEAIGECAEPPSARVVSADASFLRPLRAGDEADVLMTSSGLRIVSASGEPVAIGQIVLESC